VLVRLGPIDDADGVGSFPVSRIFGQDFLLPFAGIVEFLDAEINAGDLLEAIDVVWILSEDDVNIQRFSGCREC
jgi:hypothetical protein